MAINDFKTEDGSWNFVDRPLRDCTEEDWAKLYEPDAETIVEMNQWEKVLNIKLKDVFKCVDSYQDVAFKPNGQQRLAFYLVPCDKLPWGPYEVEDECI